MGACTPKAEKTNGFLVYCKVTPDGSDGKKTDLYTLRNKNNMEVCVTNFGGRIVSVMVPDKDGQMRDVVLGFDSIQDYVESKPRTSGASIGRYANRINQGRFTLTVLSISCLRIITVTACMAVRKDSSTVCFDAVQPNPQRTGIDLQAEDGEEGFPNITCQSVDEADRR